MEDQDGNVKIDGVNASQFTPQCLNCEDTGLLKNKNEADPEEYIPCPACGIKDIEGPLLR